jgi:hypothetical protein
MKPFLVDGKVQKQQRLAQRSGCGGRLFCVITVSIVRTIKAPVPRLTVLTV